MESDNNFGSHAPGFGRYAQAGHGGCKIRLGDRQDVIELVRLTYPL